MKKQLSQNTHCLRSKKLNDDQLLLLRHLGGQQKSKNNKMENKLLEESINNFKKENRITKKKVNYSPPSIKKSSRSNHKKNNSNNKKKNSKFLKKIKQNSERSAKKGNRKEKNLIKKTDNQNNLNQKNNFIKESEDNQKKISNKKGDDNNIEENQQNIVNNKKVGIKTLIYNYQIINIKEDSKINEEKNPQNQNIDIEIPQTIINQQEHFQNISQQQLPINYIDNLQNKNNQIITTNITNINRISNYYPSAIYTPRIEIKDPLLISSSNLLNKQLYGKIVNNKRVIFGLFHRPKEDFHKLLKKKRKRRRRLKNILNYKKYQEKLKEMPNYVNTNNEFKYIFETSHRIAKNYWHVKVDIVNSTRYVDYSDSDESYGKIRVGKKRGRKRRRIHNDDLNLAQINAISELKKNLEKTDGDMELLFNGDFIEKSSGSQSLFRDNFD